jgi:hypothetical protein
MNTKDLPIVEPNLTQRGKMDDTILKMAMVDYFKQFRERKCNSCEVSLEYDNKLITFNIILLNVVDNKPKESDVLHLDDIKQEGE